MKRCRFTNWIRQFDLEQIVVFSISSLVGIALSIILFIYLDKVPATPEDYEELEEQVEAIQKNPITLMESDYNYKISIADHIIIVEFENDECSMTARYDSSFRVLSTTEKDKSMCSLVALALALIVGAFVTYFMRQLLSVLLFF